MTLCFQIKSHFKFFAVSIVGYGNVIFNIKQILVFLKEKCLPLNPVADILRSNSYNTACTVTAIKYCVLTEKFEGLFSGVAMICNLYEIGTPIFNFSCCFFSRADKQVAACLLTRFHFVERVAALKGNII
jgi:hypothetical protein